MKKNALKQIQNVLKNNWVMRMTQWLPGFANRIQKTSGVHVTILKIKYVPLFLTPKDVNITNNWTKIRNILKMGTPF